MRKAALGLSALAMVVGGWAWFVSRGAPRPHFEKRPPSGVEAIARSLTEPAGNAASWRLKQPYPTPAQVEQALGKPDEVSSDYAWSTRFVWKTPEGETVAWFNKADGLLDALELNYGGLERIARDPIHYRREPARVQ